MSKNKYKHKQWFTALIGGVPCTGKVYISKSKVVYLCQNLKNGAEAPAKLGFLYSWGIRLGTKNDLLRNSVRNLKLHESKPKKYEPGVIIGKYFGVKVDSETMQVGCTYVTRKEYIAAGKLMDWIE